MKNGAPFFFLLGRARGKDGAGMIRKEGKLLSPCSDFPPPLLRSSNGELLVDYGTDIVGRKFIHGTFLHIFPL